MTIRIEYGDDVLRRYHNQIAAIGQGRARPALARALNRVARMAKTRVVRTIVSDTSIPRSIASRAVRTITAAHGSRGDLTAGLTATGRPISLKHFRATQLSYGVRAKVFGEWKRYPGMFMGPRPGVIAASLRGHVFSRTMDKTWVGGERTPIEREDGPSVPEALTRQRAQTEFENLVASHLPLRINHELGRLLGA